MNLVAGVLGTLQSFLKVAELHSGNRHKASGQSCAEVTVVQAYDMTIGVGRPTLDTDTAHVWESAAFWGVAAPATPPASSGTTATLTTGQGSRATARVTCSVYCWTRTPAR